MPIKSFVIVLILLFSVSAFAQSPEAGSYQFLVNSYAKRNGDIMDYLIKECNHYLHSYWNSPNVDKVLFMLANLYEEEEQYAQAAMALLKIKFIFPGSERKNDTITMLNQIVHNKAERLFRDRRKEIDALLTGTLSFTTRSAAYYDYLNFVKSLNIEDINEILFADIDHYLLSYPKDAKNSDQLLFWTGDLYEQLSDWPEAILAYKKLTFIAPQSILMPQALFQIALLQYRETSQFNDAKDGFLRLISDYAELPIAGKAQFFLAELYEKELDNKTEAVATYRLLVDTYPSNEFAVEALKRVAEIHEDQEKYQDAIAGYYQIYELYPQNSYAPEALLEIEVLYRRRLDNYEKAIETLMLYAEKYPKREDAAERLYDAAEIYEDDLNNKQAAIDTYHQVINQFPGSEYAKDAKERIEDLTTED